MVVSALEEENELLAPLVSYTRGVWHFKICQEVQVLGRDLVDKVKSLIHEGNVRRIIIRDEHGNTFMEIPLTAAAIGPFLVRSGGARCDFGVGGEIYRCGGANRR